MIEVKQINKTFGKLKALNSIDMLFKTNISYAVIGPNGAGKTTLIKSILGLVVPDSGYITVDNINTKNNFAYREKIGYMPQIGRYPDNMTVEQMINMIKGIRKDKNNYDEYLIKEFKLEQFANKKMNTLSGGTRQKVSSILAFLFDPPILILDEPTAGLDPVSVEILKDKINIERQKGKLIIITSHVMSDLDELTSEIVYVYEGNIAFNYQIENLKKETNQDKLGKAISNKISELNIN